MGKVVDFGEFSRRRAAQESETEQSADSEHQQTESAKVEVGNFQTKAPGATIDEGRLVQSVVRAEAEGTPREILSTRLRIMFAARKVPNFNNDHFFDFLEHINKLRARVTGDDMALFDRNGQISHAPVEELVEIMNNSNALQWSKNPSYFTYLSMKIKDKLLDSQPETEIIKKILDRAES